MGLFDRLFGKRRNWKSASVFWRSDEYWGWRNCQSEPAATLNDKEEQKSQIWRLITKILKRELQPLINLFQPLLKKSRQRNLVEEKANEDQVPVEESSCFWTCSTEASLKKFHH